MQQHEQLFLEALKASLNNEKVSWQEPLSKEIWKQLFDLSEVQKVLPLIFNTVFECPAAKQMDSQQFSDMRRQTIGQMMNQIQKTDEFLNLYEKLDSEGVKPLVVKGIVCRELYPNPDLRLSSDEDILVSDTVFEKSADLLITYGMKQRNSQEILDNVDEIGFLSEKGVSYIELHKHLFPESSDAYGNLNQYFSECFEKCVSINVQGTIIYTMEPGMHLFYLICHAFKHFLGSGFGIRQVCDITMFANTYGKQINWQELLGQCREIRADIFAAAIFRIGKNHLIFDEEKAAYPKEWRNIEIDETDMLLELLDSGIYGSASKSRLHSSNMTLEAVAAQKRGKKEINTVITSIFPSAVNLENRYTYLKKRPYLLPAAWLERMLKYWQEIQKTKNGNVIDAVKIGNQRIELLKKYGILKK